jgi:DNA-binding CsgD family transcriptional regulator
MLTHSEQLRLIDRIYEGALTDCGWAGALRDLAVAFRSETANIATFGLPNASVRAISFVGIEPKYQRTYTTLVALPDMHRTWHSLAAHIPSRVVTDEATVRAGSELLQSRFVNEWLRPQGMDHYIIAICTPSRSEVGGYFFGRSNRAGAYDVDAIAALKVLQPHLARAIQMTLRLATETAKARDLEAFDLRSEGVLLVDRKCGVLWANQAAEGLITAGDRLSSVDRALVCHRDHETSRLRQMVAGCSAGALEVAGGMLAVHGHSGRRPLSVLVAPLRGEHPFALEPVATAILFVTDPDSIVRVPRSHLRELYGLTEGEARTAEALLDADRLADVAQKLGVTLATVRTLLQRVFEKTDTHRQSELIRLMQAHGSSIGSPIIGGTLKVAHAQEQPRGKNPPPNT